MIGDITGLENQQQLRQSSCSHEAYLPIKERHAKRMSDYVCCRKSQCREMKSEWEWDWGGNIEVSDYRGLSKDLLFELRSEK